VAPRIFGDVRPCELDNRNKTMTGVDAHVISFQCPRCGHELEQTIGDLKSRDHMSCLGCGIGINIDTDRLSNAAEEMQRAVDKVPSEITIKFFRQ
jgi:transcription elongation factor Elf1